MEGGRNELAIPQMSPIQAQALPGVEMYQARLKALQMASDASSIHSLLAVMQSKPVRPRFYLAIPSGWAKHHNLDKSQNIILRMGKKSWNVGFYKRPNGCGGSFTRGWKKFVTDNCLQMFDVCLFDMSTERNKERVSDVSIFRVPKCKTAFQVNACSLVDSMSSTSNMPTIASTEEVSDCESTNKTSLA